MSKNKKQENIDIFKSLTFVKNLYIAFRLYITQLTKEKLDKRR